MRPATGLILVAIGAILAFAVTGHPSFLNVQVVGWVIMLTGIAGMLIPRRGYGWLWRRMALRRGPGGRPVVSHVEEQRSPPYVMLNPGATEAARVGDPAAPAPAAEWEAAEKAAAPGEPRPGEEVIEEYVEE